ncbi:MAG: hypothetical protein OXE53_02435 [Deltaproteobacteria bacterium]|nr:hypothetical protein [Deltaproteobacteria bacterium]
MVADQGVFARRMAPFDFAPLTRRYAQDERLKEANQICSLWSRLSDKGSESNLFFEVAAF